MIAKAAGFRRLVAETLPDNAAMQAVFRTVGLVHRSWFEDGVVRVQLDLTADNLLQDDADQRDWQAAVRSLRSLVDPTHVVVIGAGRSEASPGRRILPTCVESFTGRVSVVHPTAATVGGVDTVRQLDELDDGARSGRHRRAGGVCGRGRRSVRRRRRADRGGHLGGVRRARGPRDRAAQDEVLAAARRHGMRLVGPNCLGVVSTSCGLNATFTSRSFRPGGIAIASQSGGVGIAIAAEAEQRAAGISSFVSMGNKVDVSGNDLLRLWADDESTNVVLLYLESFGDPVRFARVARAVSQRKPIVALKSGGIGAGTTRGQVAHRGARQRPGDGRRPVRPHRRAAGPHAGGADRRRAAPRPPAGAGRAPGRPRRQRRRPADPRRRRRRRRRTRRAGAVGEPAGRDHPAWPRQLRRPPIPSTSAAGVSAERLAGVVAAVGGVRRGRRLRRRVCRDRRAASARQRRIRCSPPSRQPGYRWRCR